MQILPLRPDDHASGLDLFRAYAAFYQTSLDASAETAVRGWIFDEAEDFWCCLALMTRARFWALRSIR